MKRFVAVLLFSASLFAPVIGFSEEHHRYYDHELLLGLKNPRREFLQTTGLRALQSWNTLPFRFYSYPAFN